MWHYFVFLSDVIFFQIYFLSICTNPIKSNLRTSQFLIEESLHTVQTGSIVVELVNGLVDKEI